jgi:sulfotransferase
MDKIFFQSSLPRSGSSLLQNIIGQNPNFYVTPTSGVLELVYAARGNYTTSPEFIAQDSELMKNAFMGFCKGGVESYFNSITDKKYIMDKSRGWGIHYNFLNSFYPNAKVICIVRDLRDIYASMEKNFRKNQHKDSGIVNHATMQGTTTEKRIDLWAAGQPVGLALERLLQIFKEGINKNIHFIRYEDLLINPQFEMDKIYNYLGIERYIHDFNNIEQITVEDDEVYGIYGDHNIRRKLEPLKSNANEILGSNLCESIKKSYPWFYEIFNYK